MKLILKGGDRTFGQCNGACYCSKQDKQEKAKTVEVGELKLDCEGRRVFISGKEINITAKEFDVLELLVCNPNKVYSRESLLTFVWGNKASESGDVRTVDVHVRTLRQKLGEAGAYIETVRGYGYKISPVN